MRATREDGVPVELDDDGTWYLAPVPVAGEDEGFRGVPWGSAPAAAWEREGSEPDYSTEFVQFWSGRIIADLNCDIIYGYKDNMLTRGHYSFDKESIISERCMDEFFKLKEYLVLKYGEPTDDAPDWDGPGELTDDIEVFSPESAVHF